MVYSGLSGCPGTWVCRRHGWHGEGGKLPEQIQGEKDHHQREGVATRSDGGGGDKQCHDCMAAVTAEEGTREETGLADEPCHQRKLEHYAHDKDKHEEVVHIRIKRNLIWNQGAQLVIGKEAKCERENYEIARGDSEKKHHVAENECSAHPALLLLVKSRSDEAPEQIDTEGESQHYGKPERRGHVDEKLRCKPDVYQFDIMTAGG